MVVLSKGELEQIALPGVQRAAPPPPLAVVPEVDLSKAARDGRAAAARAVAAACEEYGFFKVTGHGVPAALLARVEAAANAFFALPQREKEAAGGGGGEGSPLGYGSKRIGCNGDLGWVEYLLLGVTAAGAAPLLESTSDASSCSFRELLNEYTAAVRKLTCTVLELMAEGLGLTDPAAFARLVTDPDSDSILRVNHYPPRPDHPTRPHHQQHSGRVTGFGEHTDPQLVSVLRSNATAGLEIALRDGTWVAVPPPDGTSFFVNVGDALQVMTNARFRSVRHRVVVGGSGAARPRVSVIFFGGPPPRERLAPLPEMVGEGGRRWYREFTWREYKSSAYRTKLSENRLGYFETAAAAMS